MMTSTRDSSPDLPSYRYLSLDHSIKETRLAELLPGSYDDDIYLRIHLVALNTSDNSNSEQPGFRVEDLQKDLPSDTWNVRETINGRFIFERRKPYRPDEPYETQWDHPVAGFKPIPNNYNLIHTKPEYEALSHVWGPKEDQTLIFIKPLASRSEQPSVGGPSDSTFGRGTLSGAQISSGRKRAIDHDFHLPPSKRASAVLHGRAITRTPDRLSESEDTLDTTTDDLQPTISTLAIQSDLAVALRHLRDKSRSRMLWADNICINQDDTSERGHLVRHMGQIYRLASKVIVWLGPEHSDSAYAMAKLNYLGRQVEITNKGSWRVNAPTCLEPSWSRTAVPLPYDVKTWESIRCLLNRPWFKRLWVWQEAKLSNDDSIIQCGNKKMELYRFGAAAWCAAAKANSTPEDLIVPLFRAGDAVLRQFDEPFLSTLLHLNGKDCSDPRDKIYGALGLAPPQVSANVVPDYSKAVDEVYADAAEALLKATDRVDFLLACNLANRTLAGPTWAPDWSVIQKRSPRWLLSTTLASGISVSTAEVIYAPKPTLLVQGIECGTICAVGDRAPDFGEGQVDVEAIIKSWYAECPNVEMYVHATESLFDAFVKTIHWNTLRERCPLDNSLLTLAEARQAMRRVLNIRGYQDEDAGSARKLEYSQVRGRSFIKLDNGYIGMTSAIPEETDVVCVILGCPLPMILRNCAGRYQVVGPTYVHGLMDAEALLGHLDPDVMVEVGVSSGWHGGFTFRNSKTKETLPEDPRLGKVPPLWVRTESVRKSTDPLHFCRFRNFATGKTINGDPRLLPEELRARGGRGVRLQPLQLV